MSGGDRTCDGPTEPIPGVEAGLPQRLRSSYPGDPGGGGVGRPTDRGGTAEDLRHDLRSAGVGGQNHSSGYYRTTLLFLAHLHRVEDLEARLEQCQVSDDESA